MKARTAITTQIQPTLTYPVSPLLRGRCHYEAEFRTRIQEILLVKKSSLAGLEEMIGKKER